MSGISGYSHGEWKVDDWDKSFWDKGFLPFHKAEPHRLLQKYYEQIFPNNFPRRIFVPLCGRSVDITWLADKGHEVVGLDYSEIAVTSFFKENNLSYEKCDVGVWELYKAKEKNIKIYRGDFYAGDIQTLGIFDIIWDSAALGSINPSQRIEYMTRIRCLMNKSTEYYANFYLYESSEFQGPPCSISDGVVDELCGKLFSHEMIGIQDFSKQQTLYMASNGMSDTKIRLFRFMFL